MPWSSQRMKVVISTSGDHDLEASGPCVLGGEAVEYTSEDVVHADGGEDDGQLRHGGYVDGVPAGSVVPDVDPAREQRELEEYLGPEFDLEKLHRYQETLDLEYASCGDEQAFYRTSRGYLYNLT